MRKTIKNISITGIGIALFVVLSLCLQVPIFENYYLCLGYVAMIIYLYSIGTISGTIVGTLGTILYCILISGLRGMPGWAVGNILIGFLVGEFFKADRNIAVKNKTLRFIGNCIFMIAACSIGILFVKSGVEVLLYAQPFGVRFISNIYAFIADSFVMCFSVPICWKLDKHIKNIIRGGN